MRISRDDMLMQIAIITSHRSTCNRLQVGAVVAQDGRIVSMGYAGAPAGQPHCSPETCNTSVPCTRTVHAEAGAIAYAARAGISLDNGSLYCTHCPCLDCAKLIINTGIKRVLYDKAYRKTEGLELLQSVGIIVERWNTCLLPTPELRSSQELELRTLL